MEALEPVGESAAGEPVAGPGRDEDALAERGLGPSLGPGEEVVELPRRQPAVRRAQHPPGRLVAPPGHPRGQPPHRPRLGVRHCGRDGRRDSRRNGTRGSEGLRLRPLRVRAWRGAPPQDARPARGVLPRHGRCARLGREGGRRRGHGRGRGPHRLRGEPLGDPQAGEVQSGGEQVGPGQRARTRQGQGRLRRANLAHQPQRERVTRRDQPGDAGLRSRSRHRPGRRRHLPQCQLARRARIERTESAAALHVVGGQHGAGALPELRQAAHQQPALRTPQPAHGLRAPATPAGQQLRRGLLGRVQDDQQRSMRGGGDARGLTRQRGGRGVAQQRVHAAEGAVRRVQDARVACGEVRAAQPEGRQTVRGTGALQGESRQLGRPSAARLPDDREQGAHRVPALDRLRQSVRTRHAPRRGLGRRRVDPGGGQFQHPGEVQRAPVRGNRLGVAGQQVREHRLGRHRAEPHRQRRSAPTAAQRCRGDPHRRSGLRVDDRPAGGVDGQPGGRLLQAQLPDVGQQPEALGGLVAGGHEPGDRSLQGGAVAGHGDQTRPHPVGDRPGRAGRDVGAQQRQPERGQRHHPARVDADGAPVGVGEPEPGEAVDDLVRRHQRALVVDPEGESPQRPPRVTDAHQPRPHRPAFRRAARTRAPPAGRLPTAHDVPPGALPPAPAVLRALARWSATRFTQGRTPHVSGAQPGMPRSTGGEDRACGRRGPSSPRRPPRDRCRACARRAAPESPWRGSSGATTDPSASPGG